VPINITNPFYNSFEALSQTGRQSYPFPRKIFLNFVDDKWLLMFSFDSQLKFNIDAVNEYLVTKIPVPLRYFQLIFHLSKIYP